jgi:uncharacterized protein YfaT (DUF1175 family)
VRLSLSNKRAGAARGGFPRSGALVLSFAFLACTLAVFVCAVADHTLTLRAYDSGLGADAGSACFFKIQFANPLRELIAPFDGDYALEFQRGEGLVRPIKRADGFFLQSTGRGGRVVLDVKAGDKAYAVSLVVGTKETDTDGDGFPDAAELESYADRENFRHWFVSIAESQFYAASFSWYDIHRDCAGLVVFAYKEALKKHDSDWLKNYPYLVKQDIPDVLKYNYPHVPILGDRIFRTAGGPFSGRDPENGVFAPAADVNILMNYNLTYIGSDPRVFQPGDILFFLHTDNPDMPFHSMIYTGGDGWLIYHTGPLEDKPEGEMRKVKLTDLLLHPDRSWAPVADNPCFLGAFRWNILL